MHNKIEPGLPNVLLSPGFLLGLGLLLLNDFYLKSAYGNFLTGKLSDFAGLFIFPLFVVSIIPKGHFFAYVGTAIAFLFWKTPFADFVIDLWNSSAFFKIGRTVDYTDILTLAVLPLSYYYLQKLNLVQSPHHIFRTAGTCSVLFVSVFAFTATTLTKDRLIMLEDNNRIVEKHDELEATLRESPRISDLRVRRDDEVFVNIPNARANGKTYFFDLLLDRQTCNSSKTKMSFLIEEEETHTVLRGIDIEFECREYESASNINSLDKSYKEHARSLFQQEILSRLTQAK